MIKKIIFLTYLCLWCGISLFSASEKKLKVLTTFTVPADWVRQVAGEKAEVSSLVPPNSDNHAYTPSPSDLKKIKEADFVFALSPHFETWFESISKAQRKNSPHKFIFLAEKHLSEETHCGCGHHHATTQDPHLWTDPEFVANEFIPIIAKTLNCDGNAYAKQLREFTKKTQAKFNTLPQDRREFITYHNNMSHFAHRFNLKVAGTILNSATTEAQDPSAKSLAKLIQKIRERKIPIFTDNTVSSRIPKQIAKEAGVPAPKILRIDALDVPGTPASTYLGMMQENADSLYEALK